MTIALTAPACTPEHARGNSRGAVLIGSYLAFSLFVLLTTVATVHVLTNPLDGRPAELS